jgi:hypothetical protein
MSSQRLDNTRIRSNLTKVTCQDTAEGTQSSSSPIIALVELVKKVLWPPSS